MLQLIETIAVIPTAALLFVVMLQIALMGSGRRHKYGKHSPKISVLIPAHNEGEHLGKVIDSVLDSGYTGKMEVIVIDDGSGDNTPEVIKAYGSRIIGMRTEHIGKSNALNRAMEKASGEIIVVVDGDSEVQKGSMDRLIAPFSDKSVAASAGAVKAVSTGRLLSWFQRIEYIYQSFYKSLFDKVNGNIWAPGPLSAFRKGELEKLGGFSDSMLLEDSDLAIRLVKSGKIVRYVSDAVSLTHVPHRVRDLFRQRIRWSKGIIQISKKHSDLYFSRSNKGSGFLSLPLMSYWYFHSAVIIILVFLQVFLGYYQYFYSAGVVYSMDVFQYFFYWFTLFGIVNLAWQMAAGNWPVTLLNVLNILVVGLTYFIYLYSIRWFREGLGIKDIVVLVFLFPYWILTMAAQLLGTAEWFRGEGRNWWRK